MYSNIESVQYLIAALKESGIKNAVISPGNSHNAIVRSIEEDGSFQTYSVVDERSAAFFACGLAQELHEPIIICCTAGTAATNYLTGITEAHRRNLPIVVITADKNPYYYRQGEDQMVDQITPFQGVTRYNCRLPMIRNDKDRWYCRRLINEAMLAMDHHGKGPVQIDVPIEEGLFAIGGVFSTERLPTFDLIKRYELNDPSVEWEGLFSRLHGKRVMMICGQDTQPDSRKADLLENIFEKYNCLFATDKLSNLHCKGSLEVSRATKRMQKNYHVLQPDVVISLDGASTDFKFMLKGGNRRFEHWIVNEEGVVCDPFRKLSAIFEGSTIDFLSKMAQFDQGSDHSYYQLWKDCSDQFDLPEFAFSNAYAISRLMERIPAGSNLNIGNSSPIRLAQFFDLDREVTVFCNRGVNGIDGCVSTFIGQAAARPEKLNYLIVGDLSFFYDMNALWNRYVGKNVRIMLSNNGGAALFHFNQGVRNFPTLNENVAAEHFSSAKGWAESQGFLYLSAHDGQSFDEALDVFMKEESDRPIFFEVFTEKELDAEIQHNFFDTNILPAVEPQGHSGTSRKESVGRRTKEAVKVLLGDDLVNKIRKMKP